jgi:hypothetical protein
MTFGSRLSTSRTSLPSCYRTSSTVLWINATRRISNNDHHRSSNSSLYMNYHRTRHSSGNRQGFGIIFGLTMTTGVASAVVMARVWNDAGPTPSRHMLWPPYCQHTKLTTLIRCMMEGREEDDKVNVGNRSREYTKAQEYCNSRIIPHKSNPFCCQLSVRMYSLETTRWSWIGYYQARVG